MNRDRACNLAQLNDAESGWRKWTAIMGVVLLGATSLVAQTAGGKNRIAQELSGKPNAEISGSVHALTAKSTDLGAVNSNMQMNSLTLHVRPSAAQKKEIASLLASMQDRKSPQYHKWLTQTEYGARFGLTESDLSQVKSWLSAQGFRVKGVSTSRNSIAFSGKAWQVESAFHTQLHQYKLDGETHFANASSLKVPAQFADVVMAVRGLDNFRPKPNAKRMLAHPNATFGSSNYISPGDWATIYNTNGLSDGTGVHVGVVGQSYAPQSDIDNFRAASQLSATKLAYQCISATEFCNTTATGDLAEADVDIEWAGGIAPGATVDYLYTGGGDTGASVFDALSYAVYTYLTADGNVLPIISMSYDFGCEASVNGSPLLSLFDALGGQAGLQGQTLVVAAGDSGAAGCDGIALSPFLTGPAFASNGLAVTVPADNPAFTAVGGTMFSGDSDPTLFWDPTDGLVNSALGYIPETPWNEASATGTLAAGGGGESTATDTTGTLVYPQPNWQSGLVAGSAGRLVPDVAFAAAAGHDGYLYCSSDTANGNLCASGAYFASGGTAATAGGTSVSTPAFAGLLARLVQQYGPLGNINPALYAIAADSATYGLAFHDVTSGDTNVPCQTTPDCFGGLIGFSAAPGYDQATGLGSVDGVAMSTALATYMSFFPSSAASATTVSASPNPVAFGSMVTLTATVTSPAGPTPTGSVTFSTADALFFIQQPLVSGVATVGVPATVANGLGVGSKSITAVYAADTNPVLTNASHGSTALTVQPGTPSVVLTPSATSITTTQALTVTVAVNGVIGNPTPTGSVTLTGGGYTSTSTVLAAGSATINIPAASLSAGTDTLTVTYAPDTVSSPLYNAASNTTSVTVTIPARTTPTLALTPSLTSITTAQALSVTIAVNATTSNPTPTGSVILAGGGYTSTSTVLAAGSATINLPAGALTLGTDTLTVSYTPDTVSSPLYNAASSTTSVTVTLPAKTTPAVVLTPSLTSLTTAQALSLTVAVNATVGNPTPTGSVILAGGGYTSLAITISGGSATINIPAKSLSVGTDTLTVSFTPDTASATVYNGASNTTTVTVTLPAKTTPTVVLTPSATSITTTQALSVMVAVNATTGNPTPTGSVILTGGGYTSLATTISGGSATINVPAGSLTAGADTLTVTYTPDTASAPTYNGASNTTSVTVTTAAKTTPTMALTPSSSSITTAQALAVTVAVSATPTPTGSVILKGGGYTSTATALTAGGVIINVPAGSLTTGTDTLTVTYTPDTASSSLYNSTSKTTSVTVVVPTYTLTASPNPVTVSANGSSMVTLTLATANYGGTIALAISPVTSTNGTASNVTVNASATSVTLAAGGTGSTQTVTLTIAANANAANHAPALPWKSGGALVFGAVLLGVPYGRRKRVVAVLLTALAISLAGFLVACGGGGGSGKTTTPPPVTARTYTFTVTPTGSVPVKDASPVTITVTVP